MTAERPRKRRKKQVKRTPKQVAKSIELEQRRAKAIKLKIEGKGYRQIAKQLGISVDRAYDDVQVILDETRKEARNDAEQERRMQLERLDLAVDRLLPLLKLRDKAAAAATALKGIEERRARLLGLDQPARFEHSGPEGGPIQLDARDALFERISGLVLGAAAGTAAGEDHRPNDSAGSGDNQT